MKTRISKMSLSDLETIKDILSTDFDDFWTYNILLDELKNKNSNYFVAKSKNNEIIGFAGIKITIDTADIMNIVVKKDVRNQGIGTLLLENLLSLCKELNLQTIFLEVNENNISAIKLYEKNDFKKISTRKNYYKNQTATIMQKVLKE